MELKRGVHDLESALRRADRLLDDSPLSLIEWSVADGVIVRWSREATRLFGYTAAEIIGTKLTDRAWFHPEDLPGLERSLTELRSGSQSRTGGLCRNRRKDGSWVECEWFHARVDDDSGTSTVLSQVIDATERRRTEEALREKESILRTALDNAPFELWARDADGICIVANAAALRWGQLLGRRPEDSGVAPEVLAIWQDNNRRALAGEVVRREIEHLVDGERREFECVVAPIRVADEVQGILGFNIDITQRRLAEQALRESEQRLRDALSVGRMGYLDWNLLTNEITWSAETYRLFGYEPGGGFSPTLESTVAMVPPEERACVAARLEAAVEGTVPYDIDHRMIRPDGQLIHVHAQGEVQRDDAGRALRLLGTVVDITERKRAEQALREADRRKSEFLGMLSHELRNPLTSIRNSLYALSQPQSDGAQRDRAHAIIARQTNHLVRLVDDLLDVTRISQGKIHLQRTRLDVSDVLRSTIDDHRALFAGRELLAEVPNEPVWIDGDATRLAQIFGNVLNNAAKFTPAKGRVTVSLTAGQADAVLEFADTGVGIDADTLERLFEPFAQADRSLDRSSGGLGLGLALVKALVVLHGGEVLAHSDGPGRGARFTIRLKLDEREAAAERVQPAETARHVRRSILIIEDNRDAAASLRDALTLAGHEVAIAHDGKAGLVQARALKPHVILCDVGLPGELDGYEVARALRSDPSANGVFLVAITGYLLPEDQRQAREAGFDAHLGKPPDLHALSRLLSDVPSAPH